MIQDLGIYNNEVNELRRIDLTRYESIFQVAKNGKYFFYNILKKINIPDTIDKDYYFEITTNSITPLTTLSFNYYNTQDLWWLICITNNIQNPINNIEVGTKLKILNRDIVDNVITRIHSTIRS